MIGRRPVAGLRQFYRRPPDARIHQDWLRSAIVDDGAASTMRANTRMVRRRACRLQGRHLHPGTLRRRRKWLGGHQHEGRLERISSSGSPEEQVWRMAFIEVLREQTFALPPLAKFAVVIAVIVGVPALARRVGVPEMVGLPVLSGARSPCSGLLRRERQQPTSLPSGAAAAEAWPVWRSMSHCRVSWRQSDCLWPSDHNDPTGSRGGFGLAGYAVIPAIVIGSLMVAHASGHLDHQQDALAEP